MKKEEFKEKLKRKLEAYFETEFSFGDDLLVKVDDGKSVNTELLFSAYQKGVPYEYLARGAIWELY